MHIFQVFSHAVFSSFVLGLLPPRWGQKERIHTLAFLQGQV